MVVVVMSVGSALRRAEIKAEIRFEKIQLEQTRRAMNASVANRPVVPIATATGASGAGGTAAAVPPPPAMVRTKSLNDKLAANAPRVIGLDGEEEPLQPAEAVADGETSIFDADYDDSKSVGPPPQHTPIVPSPALTALTAFAALAPPAAPAPPITGKSKRTPGIDSKISLPLGGSRERGKESSSQSKAGAGVGEPVVCVCGQWGPVLAKIQGLSKTTEIEKTGMKCTQCNIPFHKACTQLREYVSVWCVLRRFDFMFFLYSLLTLAGGGVPVPVVV